MVNVQAFVTVMVVTSSLSMVYLIMALIILVHISRDVERICHYSMDIFDMVRDIKFRCIDFKDDNSNKLVELHRIEKQLDSELNMFERLSGDISVIKKHTEKIEKNSAIK